MIIPATFEEKTGFDIIRQMLKGYCLGEGGKALVDEMHFNTNRGEIEFLLDITDEFRTMILTVFGYPSSEYYDLDDELTMLLTEGSYMAPEVLVAFRVSYSAFTDAVEFINNLDASRFPKLTAFVAGVRIENTVIPAIDKILDQAGNVRDNASDELLTIRRETSRLRTSIDRRIAEALSHAKQQKIVPPDTEIAIRDGHAVIPVAAAMKRKLGGVIIDESASGQTSYIEPTEVFEIRNSLRELELAEKREIIKILIRLADFLRPYVPGLKEALSFLSELDFLRAKALLALETTSLKPAIIPGKGFSWLQARHPLLMLSLKKQHREIVPSNISLDAENRILVISGPNAGGKSVCLKTAGLLQYMLQCGLLIPVLDTSEAGIFDSLFIDIGDQQSIENDLSTYSSHLLNIKNLLSHADSSTLFLIDEFGAGTEPQSGGAIAEAVLEALNEKGAFGIVTTHYANLKMLAGRHPGFVNGAMLYDSKHMKPMFVLKTGKPGSSFAFEIAANIEFPAAVLAQAAEKVGHDKLDFDKQMQDLEAERMELAMKEKQLQQADEMLSELISRYSVLKTDLDARKKEIMEAARTEAKQIIDNSNRIIERTIREIKETKADTAAVKKSRAGIREFAETIDEKMPEEPAAKPEPPAIESEETIPGEPAVGDHVRMQGQQQTGIVTQLIAGEATVAFDQLIMKIPVSKLEKTTVQQSAPARTNRGSGYQNMINDMNARMANFRLTIDVRGHRAGEAEMLIQRYIDEAIMLRVKEISILHGKGNGILRSLIRQYLQSVAEIKHFGDAPVESGGAGITLVTFY